MGSHLLSVFMEMLHFSVDSPAYILSTFPCGLNYTDKLVIVNTMGTEELVKLISSIFSWADTTHTHFAVFVWFYLFCF